MAKEVAYYINTYCATVNGAPLQRLDYLPGPEMLRSPQKCRAYCLAVLYTHFWSTCRRIRDAEPVGARARAARAGLAFLEGPNSHRRALAGLVRPYRRSRLLSDLIQAPGLGHPS